MRDKLIELIKEAKKQTKNANSDIERNMIFADYLLKNGVIVPLDALYSIVDKGTIYATVSKTTVDWLPLYVIKAPEKYGYYRKREEAEQALKGGAE
jgi:hypothetical protein